jgi:hypothetical protein
MVATCADQTLRLAVDNGVGVAPDCIHSDALNPGNSFDGAAMIIP